jgi:hypothetical protein
MRRRIGLALTAAIAIGAAVWCLWPDTVIARNTDLDEGVYLMVARLLHHGYDTHAFFFDQFWLFPKIITAGFALFGDSLMVGRLIVFVFSLAGLLGVALLSYQLGGRWMMAVAAVLIGAIDPLYILGSRMTLADVPAMTCIVWALIFIFLFATHRSRVWIGLSGLLAGASLVLKPFTLGFAVTILLVLFNQRIEREDGRLNLDWAILTDLLIFGAAIVLVAMPFVNFLHPIDEYQRVIGFHWAERNWMTKRVDDRWRGLLAFARLNVPLLLFGISGVIALRPLSFSLMALLAGEFVTAGILLEMPPWVHHYILILPPLIVFAALGFNRGVDDVKQTIADWRNGQRSTPVGKWIALLFGAAMLVTLIDLPWVIKYDRHARFPEPLQINNVVQYTDDRFQPNQYLMSDDALVPYLAGRLIPPSAINFVFGDVMKFNRPSLLQFEQIVRDNHIAGVITTTRYPRNPQLMSWLQQTFPVSIEIGTERPKGLRARVYSQKQQH